MNNQNNSSAPELLPCPFCGGAARIESNRDWHKLTGDHDDDCVFVEPVTLQVPATDDQLAALVADWNRRATQPPADRVQGGLTMTDDQISKMWSDAGVEAMSQAGCTVGGVDAAYNLRPFIFARAILSRQSMMGAEAHGDFQKFDLTDYSVAVNYSNGTSTSVLSAAPKEQAERAGVPEKAARMLESAFFGQSNWLRVREVTAAIRALAAPSPQEGNDCENCHKCLDGKTTDAGFPIALTRMILCPNCGNKRCPKASDHTLACTNSNEPGQVGSVYGIATPATAAAANGDGLPPMPKAECLIVGVFGYLAHHMSNYGRACYAAGRGAAVKEYVLNGRCAPAADADGQKGGQHG